MTTPRETPEASSAFGGDFAASELTAAERELQEVLAAAKALGIETEEAPDQEPIDTAAATALVELGLDRPIEREATPIASFLQEDDEATLSEPEPELPLEGIQEPDAAWFAVNTYSEFEYKVRDDIDLRIRSMDAERLFVELNPQQAAMGPAQRNRALGAKRVVLVPTQQEVEIKGGKRREVERKLLPGYVLLQIRLNPDTGEIPDDAWHLVKNTTGVTGFVGTREEQRERPVALSPDAIRNIIGQTQVEEPQIRVGFSVGDAVRLTDGPFLDMVAEVEEINIEKGKVRVRISMFGRETPLELDFDQVEKQ